MIRKMCLSLVAGLVVCLALIPQMSFAEDGFMLLSVQEAKELQLDDAEWEEGGMPKSFGFGIGPKIIFESPQVEETDKGLIIASPSQMDLLVVFRDGVSPVDMETLNIKAKKGWFSKNLTKRLQPYLHGQSLKAENVKIPSGRFKLEIKVSDHKGNESLQEYLCEIRDE